MQNRNLKIAFSGPSGLGKSTLCKVIGGTGVAKWLSTSAGDILTGYDKKGLEIRYGYKGTGHKSVINLSSRDPEFGVVFQSLLQLRRAEQISSNSNFVIDRCPIDNVVYMLSQIGHNVSDEWIGSFIYNSLQAYKELTHVIQIRYSPDMPKIEDNGSRIANSYFQRYISDVFTGVYSRYFANVPGPRVITLDFWDLEERSRVVKTFLGDPTQPEFAFKK